MEANKRTRISAILAGMLAVLMVLAMTPMMPGAGVAHADEEDYPEIVYGSKSDLAKSIFKDTANTEKAQKIHYGNYDWHVIGYDKTGAASLEGNMTLLADEPHNELIKEFDENNNSNIFAQSTLKTFFDRQAQNCFVSYDNYKLEYLALKNRTLSPENVDAVMWPLSLDEASAVIQQLRANDTYYYNTNLKYWWLRSPGTNEKTAAYVDPEGVIHEEGADILTQYGVRPAIDIDLDSILLISSNTNGKQFINAYSPSDEDYLKLKKVEKNKSGDWKLTIKDPELFTGPNAEDNFSVDSNASLCEGSHTRVNITYHNMSLVSLSRNPDQPANSSISGFIKDKNGNITYYGIIKVVQKRIGQEQQAIAEATEGTITLELDGIYNEGDHLYILNEVEKGSKATDFASEPVEITLPQGFGHNWEFKDFSWTGNDKDGYTAKANYKCKKEGCTGTKSVNAGITTKSSEATCTSAAKTTYTAAISAGDSPDGAAHSEDKVVTTGSALGHNMTAHPAVEETCTTDGNSAYWYCDRCKNYFSDKDGEHVITENSWVINKLGHNMTEHPAVKETCITDGNSAYWSCDRCKNYFADSQGNNKIEEGSWVIGKLGHDWGFVEFTWQGTAENNFQGTYAFYNCKRNCGLGVPYTSKDATVKKVSETQPTCTEAGTAKFEASITAENSADGEAHSATKTVTISPALGHHMTEHPAVAATCTTAGNSAYWYCDRCNNYFSDKDGEHKIAENSWVINKLGHHMTEHPAVEETCTTAGNSAYWYCDRCEKYFSDSQGNKQITENSWVIPAKGHDWKATVEKKATTDEDGLVSWKCDNKCGTNKDDSVIHKVSNISLNPKTFTYDGKAKKPSVTVKDSEGVQLTSADYETAYKNNTNAGTATVTVTLKGNYYEGKKDLTFKVNKAGNTLAVKGKAVKIKYKAIKKKAQTIKRAAAMTVSNARGKVTYILAGVKKAKFKKYFTVNANSGNITVKKKLKKGKYSVTVKVRAAGDANYNAVEKNAAVSVTVK